MHLPLEMLGIVLFRFRPVPRVWVIALIAVKLGSLAFIEAQYGLANLLATLAGIGVMILIYARLGFVTKASQRSMDVTVSAMVRTAR